MKQDGGHRVGCEGDPGGDLLSDPPGGGDMHPREHSSDRPKRRNVAARLVAFVALGVAGSGAGWPMAAADEVVLTGGGTFSRVQVTGFKGGVLHFRGLSGETLKKPISQVERVECDDVPQLAIAEQAAAAGAWSGAADALARAATAAKQPWQRDLARCRLVRALDEADEFDKAVALYLELVAEMPAAAGALSPRKPGPPGGGQIEIALRALRTATAQSKSPDVVQAARRLTLELSIYQDADVISGAAAEVQGGGPSSGGASNNDMGKPKDGAAAAKDGAAAKAGSAADKAEGDDAPLMFDAKPKRRAGGAAGSGTRLAGDSWLLGCAREKLDKGDPRTAAGLLARAVTHIDDERQATWRLALGHARLKLLQFDAAAAEFERAATAVEPAIVRESRYYRGVACERAGRYGEAMAAYRSVIEDADAPLPVREKASEGLRRCLAGK